MITGPHRPKDLFGLSKKCLFSFLFVSLFALLTAGCHSVPAPQSNDYGEAWLQTQKLVEEFGQVSSRYHVEYLASISERLTKPFREHGHSEISPRIILLNTKQPLALWPGSDFVLISRGLILTMGTESELAFVIAHELSHKALGHSHVTEDGISDPLTSTGSEQELEADHMALGIIALAGYDPRAAVPALQNAYRAAGVFAQSNEDYPPLQIRIEKAVSAINGSKWSGLAVGDRREYQTFRRSLR